MMEDSISINKLIVVNIFFIFKLININVKVLL